MRLVWIYFLAILIAITSVVYEQHSIQLSHSTGATLEFAPAWEMPLSKASETRVSQKHSPIVNSFVAIVLLADFSYQIHVHDFYLPLHSFHKEKDYFLLI